MNVAIDSFRHYTIDEYYELESKLPDAKLEYCQGTIVDVRELIYADPDAIHHSLIGANLSAVFGTPLKRTELRVCAGSLRCRTPSGSLFAYPSLTVIRGKPEVESRKLAGETLLNPLVVVEIFSPSMEQRARGRKFARYQEIPSLLEYVLIDRADYRVDVYSRQSDNAWSLKAYSGTRTAARVPSLGIDMPLSEIYYGVNLPSCD